jgi:hypothetical protein
MLAMYVAELGSTGYFVVSSMRVFHGLSAGKIAQPPKVGMEPVPPPLLLPLPLLPDPLLLPELPLPLPPLLLDPLLDPPPLDPLLLDPLLLDPLLLPWPPLLLELLELLELPLAPPSVSLVARLPSLAESPPAHPATTPAHTHHDTRERTRITTSFCSPLRGADQAAAAGASANNAVFSRARLRTP